MNTRTDRRFGRRFPVAAIAFAVAALAAVAPASAPERASLDGTVVAGGRPLAGATVTLNAGSATGVTRLGDAVAGPDGAFEISYEPPDAGIVYADATGPSASSRLTAVVGDAQRVTVNELTTVATGYALAQFTEAKGIAGPSPGLENAAATAGNLADATTGEAGPVVTNADNGTSNETLATLNTLANLVTLCARPVAGDRCAGLLRLATPPGGPAPPDPLQAMVALARNPTLSTARLFALSRAATGFEPALKDPPSAWMLALLYTEDDLYASGRIAIDASGNVWSSNNWQPGTQTPSTAVTVLDPTGKPVNGSPINGGGMRGGAWGAAIALDGTAWFGSFGGDAMSQYSSTGAPLSPAAGFTDGPLDHPQGVAVDQKGNIWIANNYGPESEPGQGSVVVYPGGDPAKALTITGGGLNHPFAVQIDGEGNAWVTNAGLGGAKLVNTRAAIFVGKFGGSVTVIGPDFTPTRFSPIEDKSLRWPLGLALDSRGNAWTVSFFSNTVTELRPNGTVAANIRLPGPFSPWGNAVDGSYRIWVAGFSEPAVWVLCGEDIAACPPGSSTGTLLSPKLGFRSKAIQHMTSLQIDQSGNVWLSNNWSNLVPPVGGTGIVELVGMATPVCTPLLALPVRPSGRGCGAAFATATAAPAVPAAASDTAGRTRTWLAAGLGAIVLAGGVLLLLVRRRRVRAAGSSGPD